MYLKSLVLKGFKSFADKSTLALEPGITAIVGPNGSGKSNISDAVLWVLGERNVKHLRGQDMEDIVFNGSVSRKPSGVAEVTLVLDNADATLPVEYTEVAITRRMYRDGLSDYLINGHAARRMDVLDILHDSGLGTGTHSIISQGNLDAVLQSKPEDRRALIEEAAGVLKHKQRKAKSERKLERMDVHVSRVRDVTREIERQLGPLERKAKRAESYKRASEELADVSLRLAVQDLRELRDSWNKVAADEAGLETQVEEARARQADADAAVEALADELRNIGDDAGALARNYHRASSAMEHLDSVSRVVAERRRAARDRAGEIALSLEAGKARLREAEKAREQAQARAAEVHGQREQAQADVVRLTAVHKEAFEARAALDERIAAVEQALRTSQDERELARAHLSETKDALASGLAHIKVIESHAKDVALRSQRANAEAGACVDSLAQAQEALTQAAAAEASLRQKAGAALQACEAARQGRDEAAEALRSIEADIKSLQQIERQAAIANGPAPGWAADHAAEYACTTFAFSHALSVEPEWEALAERLLSSDVTMLLVEDAAAAERLADALRSHEVAGEAAFLPLSGAQSAAMAEEAAHAARVPFMSKVSCKPGYEAAVRALLGDVVVCPNLHDALAAHAADEQGLRFATPDGSLVWPSGKVSTGAVAAGESHGALARARHLAECQAQHALAAEALEAAKQTVAAAEAELRLLQEQSMEASRTLAQCKGTYEAARSAHAEAAAKAGALSQEMAAVTAQQEEARKNVDEAAPVVEAIEAQVAQLDASIAQQKTELSLLYDEHAPKAAALAHAADELSERKLASAQLVERDIYLARMAAARVQEVESLRRSAAEDAMTLRLKQAAEQHLEPLQEVFATLLASATVRAQELERQADATRDSSTGISVRMTEAREAARQLRAQFDAQVAALSEARIEKGRLEVQVKAKVTDIERDFSISLDTALQLPALEDADEARESAEKLRRRIANMGTINPDAADEYRLLKERFDYISGQLADLEAARRALGKIDRALEARMKDSFRATFNVVDANFQEVFAELFPGGAAHLSLTDPDDLEHTGVEVSAQPAGKRIAKMSLMSGGEKSLTALALLFALYRTRSTPFYILDEVEAALDDTNLRRLAAYIDGLRSTTQLLMITHQRRTMEMADVLFGISMQADGVSKVVSQRLDHALQFAE